MTNTSTILRASVVLRSLLALSFALLLATGCGGGSQGAFLPPPQSDASAAAVDQFNRNLAMMAPQPKEWQGLGTLAQSVESAVAPKVSGRTRRCVRMACSALLHSKPCWV